MPTLLYLLGLSILLFISGCDNTSPDTDPPRENEIDTVQGTPALAIVDVNVIPMDENIVLRNMTVLVGEGKILTIGPHNIVSVPPGIEVIDGSGKYLMPGLADMHGHVGSDERDLIPFLANGITTLRVPNGRGISLSIRDRIKAGELIGPQMFVSSPITDGDPPLWPGNLTLSTEEDAIELVEFYKQSGYDFVKIYSKLQPAIFRAIVETANRLGLPVIGHVPEAVGLASVLEARILSTEHLLMYPEAVESSASDVFGQPTPRRAYGAIEIDDALLTQVASAAAASGVWTCPTLILGDRMIPADEGALLMDTLSALRYVSPGRRSSWDPLTNGYTRIGTLEDSSPSLRELGRRQRRKIVQALHEAGAGLLLGTDANFIYIPPGFSIYTELQNFVEAGLSPYEALRTGTYNAAESLTLLDEFGTIEAGKRADLLLLNANPLLNVHNTASRTGIVVRGQWFSEDSLKEMLEDLALSYGN